MYYVDGLVFNKWTFSQIGIVSNRGLKHYER